jgi:hypothetical protein
LTRLPTVVEGPRTVTPLDPIGFIANLLGGLTFSAAAIWFVLARSRR